MISFLLLSDCVYREQLWKVGEIANVNLKGFLNISFVLVTIISTNIFFL